MTSTASTVTSSDPSGSQGAPTQSAQGHEPAGRPTADLNAVVLRGRLSGVPQSRQLPSGDCLVSLRLVVRREPPPADELPGDEADPAGTELPAPAGRARQLVDTVDCSCWTDPVRERALRLVDGARLEVRGRLRRRFYRSPAGPASRYDVEVLELLVPAEPA